MRGEFRQWGSAHFLEALGQLARHRRRPITERRRHIRQRFGKPVRRFVPDQRSGKPGPFGGAQSAERSQPGGSPGRREPEHQKGQGRQPRQHQRRDCRVRPGNRADRQALGERRPHQPIARVGHHRGAGVGYQRNSPASPQRRQYAWDRRVLIVLVQRPCPGTDTERGEQPGSVPGVFAQHEVGGGQGGPAAWRQVIEVADRRGNQHKTCSGLSRCIVVGRCGA